MANNPQEPPHSVLSFHVSLAIERHWIREALRAILGTILFHRVLGSTPPRTVEVCGVTFPAPADADLDKLVRDHVETFIGALEQAPSKSSRMYLSLYPTTKAPKLPSYPKPRPQSQLSTTLNWFSASTKALVGGAPDEGSTAQRGSDKDDPESGKPWEGYVLDVEVVSDRRGPAGSSEERLRSQLNDFLLRMLTFTMDNTSHVPPITSGDVAPFGIQILVNPSAPPFVVKQQTLQPSPFPLLQKQLVQVLPAGTAAVY